MKVGRNVNWYIGYIGYIRIFVYSYISVFGCGSVGVSVINRRVHREMRESHRGLMVHCIFSSLLTDMIRLD